MPKEVKPGLRKQDVTISDATSTARLVLWQDDIDKLVANGSYSFRNLQVRLYAGEKYLQVQKYGSSMVPVSDIGDVLMDG